MTNRIWGSEDVARELNGISVELPSIAVLANGGYVVIWRENYNSAKIAFQVYGGDGAKIGEPQFADNGTARLNQRFADAHATSDGGFVITWNEDTAASGNQDVFSRKFSATGVPSTATLPVHPTAADIQNNPAVTGAGAGGWATVYTDQGDIKFVRQSSAGVADAPITIPDNGATASLADVAFLSGNKYVVSYQTTNGVQFNIVEGATAQQSTVIGGATLADVAGLKDAAGNLTGAFVVLTQAGTSLRAYVYGSNHAAGGQPLRTIDLQAVLPNSGDEASITALRGGGFAVAYVGRNGTDNGDVFIQAFDANGVATGSPILVNSRAALDNNGGQRSPVVVEMADGRLSVAWHDPTIGNSQIATTIVDTRVTSVLVNGTSGDDIYAGTDAPGSVINAGAGNDKLIGGSGAEQLNGGDGIDTLSYERSGSGVIASLAAGGTGGDALGDAYTSIENLKGSAFADVLSGNTSTNRLEGGTGNDTYYIDATDQVIEFAGGGTDVVYTSATSIDLGTMAGVEVAYSTSTSALGLTGNGLNNVLNGNVGDDSLNGKDGNDTLEGGAGNDALYGEAGDDVFAGGTGNDTMVGGSGNDIYNLDSLADVFSEGVNGGIDTINSTVNVTLGGNEIEVVNLQNAGTVNGNNFATTINASNGNDLILALGGNDRIYGNAGADRIKAGAGNDFINGGAGKDVFVFDTALNKRTNVDKIERYVAKDDVIWLENKFFKGIGRGTEKKPGKMSTDAFVIASKAQDAEDRIIYDKKSGKVFYDQDGTGSKAQVHFATLDKNLKLIYTEFLVI